MDTSGFPYDDLYEPTQFGSAGGGPLGGRGGGKIWLNISDTLHVDGLVSVNAENGEITLEDGANSTSTVEETVPVEVVVTKNCTVETPVNGTNVTEVVTCNVTEYRDKIVTRVIDNHAVGGGGSAGSIWIHCHTIAGYGLIHAQGGNGSANSNGLAAGGGAGGRIAMYFQSNRTFTDFRYLANGGHAGKECDDCLAEAGGAGTIFLYNMHYQHRTLIIDNNGAPPPRERYVNWANVTLDGNRAWIMAAESGLNDFARGSHQFHFEEIQVYGNAHLAVLPPVETYDGSNYAIIPQFSTEVYTSSSPYNVSFFFKYMIGDRSGTVHIADRQELDLSRREIDLPFSAYVYAGGHIGLALDTYVHGVEVHLAGKLSNVENLTIHHGGLVWLKHGGHSAGDPHSQYTFDTVRVQDRGVLNASTDPIAEPGIVFHTGALFIEGGGFLEATCFTVNAENITIDDGGVLSANGRGYHPNHTQAIHGDIALHGLVNEGMPDEFVAEGVGAGHGGSGGRGPVDVTFGAGRPYGDLYEPYVFGSAGGPGPGGLTGGTGGGILWMNVTGFIKVDGVVSADGGFADSNGGGGGSGGSIWMYCNLIQGYGKISSNGGAGSINVAHPGGGGAGGRIAIYFWHNETMTGFKYHTRGGPAGKGDVKSAENGGAGTAFLYHMMHQHRTLIVDNGGLQARDPFSLTSYNLSEDGSRTWIMPQSGRHPFASFLHVYDYSFEEFRMFGEAHLAILTTPVDAHARILFLYMIGDKSGTLHLGNNQTMDLERPEIELPFSVRAYAGSYVGLAPISIVHNVSIWMHGELDHVVNMTLHHKGMFSMENGGHTTGDPANHFVFFQARVQDNATVKAITDPVSESGMTINISAIFVEGGGTFYGTNMTINAENITIDDGGSLHADGMGYRDTDEKTGVVNIGMGHTDEFGSSGAGHGGSSGRGGNTELTGQPYGNLFEPRAIGSTGGGGEVGGRGGGVIRIDVTRVLVVDGELRADGGRALGVNGGGGSGGSVWITTVSLRGTGNITVNGGGQYEGGSGGGGAAGRIALYLWRNDTYVGTYQAHGGSADMYSVVQPAEPGGPGTAFIYHMHHQHSTIYVNNDQLVSHSVAMVTDYLNTSRDSFKAWFLPESGDHWLAKSSHKYYFDELQIFGNAHLAILPEPFTDGASLYFRYMIGDRSGVVHVGPHQVMDLERSFIDTPFSVYVYALGYLGLAPNTEIQRVFIHVEGTVDRVFNLTLVQGGELRLFQSGSTNNLPRLNYRFNGTTVIKADSCINASEPFAHSDQFQLQFGHVIVEGGGKISGKNMKIRAGNMFVDDGGYVDVSDGGHLSGLGKGLLQIHFCSHLVFAVSSLYPSCGMCRSVSFVYF